MSATTSSARQTPMPRPRVRLAASARAGGFLALGLGLFAAVFWTAIRAPFQGL